MKKKIRLTKEHYDITKTLFEICAEIYREDPKRFILNLWTYFYATFNLIEGDNDNDKYNESHTFVSNGQKRQ